MRLIDAEELNKDLTFDICGKPLNGHRKTNYANIRASILAQPTIDPETLPIVQELRGKIKLLEYQHDLDKNGFEQLEKKYNSLLGEFAESKKQIAKVTAQRDAVMQDLKKIKPCGLCVHYGGRGTAVCKRHKLRLVGFYDQGCCNWEWRGLQEAQDNE